MDIKVWQAGSVTLATVDGSEPLPTPWVRLADAVEGLRSLHPYAIVAASDACYCRKGVDTACGSYGCWGVAPARLP